MKRTVSLGLLALCTVLATAACSSQTTASPASPTVQSASATTTASRSTAAAASTPCMVGTWHATDVAITAGSGTMSGGSGAVWTISSGGDESVDWTGSGDFAEKGVSLFHYLGTETERVTLPTGSSTSGAWSATVLTDHRSAVEPAGTKSVPSTAGVTSSGTWTCSSGALHVDAHAEGSTVVVALKRAS